MIEPRKIRRILLVIDSRVERTAFESITQLALQMQAELFCLFVEDINLLRLSRLPGAQEVGMVSGHAHRLYPHEVETTLQLQADMVKSVFYAVTDSTSLIASFQIVCGHLAPEVLLLAEQADFIILVQGQKPNFVENMPLSLLSQLTEKFSGPIAILKSVRWLEQILGVIIDHHFDTKHILSDAIHLLARRTSLQILIIAQSEKKYQKLQHRLATDLAHRQIAHPIFYTRITADAQRLLAQARALNLGGIILSRHLPFAEDKWLCRELLHANIPIIWVE